MTKHMFRWYIGVGPMSLSDLETRVNSWVNENGEWAEESDKSVIKELYADDDVDKSNQLGYQIQVWFLLDNSKSNLIQKFEDKLKDKVAWYRGGHHPCDHDSETREECVFDPAAEWTAKDVTIPSGVPTFS